MSREAAPRELEVEAAGLIRAALTGDEFAIDRIVTRAYEDDLDWRSFANRGHLYGRVSSYRRVRQQSAGHGPGGHMA